MKNILNLKSKIGWGKNNWKTNNLRWSAMGFEDKENWKCWPQNQENIFRSHCPVKRQWKFSQNGEISKLCIINHKI